MHNLKFIRRRFPQQSARIIAVIGLISAAALVAGLALLAL